MAGKQRGSEAGWLAGLVGLGLVLGCNAAPPLGPPAAVAPAGAEPAPPLPPAPALPATPEPATPELATPELATPAQGPTLVFTAPEEGARVRASGSGPASVPIALQAVGVDSVELRSRSAHVTLRSPPWMTALDVHENGRQELQAIGRDAAGLEVLRVVRSVDVEGVVGSCQDELRASGAKFAPGPETRAIDEPVLLEPVLEGVAFRARGATRPSRLLVACALGLRLVRLAKLARQHGVDEVLHLGVHNYRPMRNPTCIERGNCKLSQHAYATAIDLYGFRVAATGVVYSAERDWVIDTKTGVCPGSPRSEGDALLHRMACEMHAARLFNVILTPNYNALHRDHLHADLTPASATIRGEEMGIDPAHPELLDD